MTIVFGLLALGLSIAFHELGHFLALKLLGYNVKRFSIGIGPGVSWQRGGTQYIFSPLLIGGYVQHDEEKTPWRDFLVAFAGPLFSLVGCVLSFYLALGFKVGTFDFGQALVMLQFIIEQMELALSQGPISDQLMGPVGMVNTFEKATTLVTWLGMVGVVNLSLFILNMIPIPPLDGGQMFMCVLRAVTRRSLETFRAVVSTVGAVAMLALILYATYNDISALF